VLLILFLNHTGHHILNHFHLFGIGLSDHHCHYLLESRHEGNGKADENLDNLFQMHLKTELGEKATPLFEGISCRLRLGFQARTFAAAVLHGLGHD
jgi:hypothetical protein